jgi:hypothetical protein
LSANKKRTPTWLVVIIADAGALFAGVLAFVGYLKAAPPMHSDPQQVPSVTELSPSSKWAGAAEQARQIAVPTPSADGWRR